MFVDVARVPQALFAPATGETADKLPPDAQRMRSWVLSRWQHLTASVNPFEAEELAMLRTERDHGRSPLEGKPLVVTTRGIPDEDGPGGNVVELERRKKEQAELAKSPSRNGRQVIVDEAVTMFN